MSSIAVRSYWCYFCTLIDELFNCARAKLYVSALTLLVGQHFTVDCVSFVFCCGFEFARLFYCYISLYVVVLYYQLVAVNEYPFVCSFCT